MKARSTFTRVLGTAAVVPLLSAGILLGFPSLTQDAAPLTTSRSIEAATSPVATTPAKAGAADPMPAPASPAVAGMVVGIDPETGAIGMPTLEQQRELSNMERARRARSLEDQAALVPVFHTDGSISVDLKGQFQEFATVRIDPSGKKTFRCLDGKENADRAIANPPAAEAR